MSAPIIVPLDGSMLAERALASAQSLARRQHAELRLVRVAPLEPILALADPGLGVLYPEQPMAAAWQATNQYLLDVQKSCAAADLAVSVEVREGEVAGEIVDAAQQAKAGLIVMSSHGYSGLNRWLLGSVAEKVLPSAPCPVWVVRTTAAPQHMLIALDGSALAEMVLPVAFDIATCFDSPVTLLRVVPELSAAHIASLEGCEPGLSRRYADEMLTEAADYLNQVKTRCATWPVLTNTAVRSGSAAETILDYAERHAVDLVAMTTHGRTGLRRWIYGSVMHKVLAQLPVSMLVSRSTAAALN
jgi:nucleotide-binding universal stress UspA family protein